MRTGIIDLGTNSIRFDIHQFGPGEGVRRIHREKIMVRLGEGVFLDGKLHAEACRRTLHAILKFRRTADQLGVRRVLAFGTSALREARDRDRFIKLVQEKSGISLRVLSGAEEASLIALGVLKNEPVEKSKFGLIDIGGGSTEISICKNGKLLHSASFPLGTARLQQIHLKKIPPGPERVRQLRRAIRSRLAKVMMLEHWPRVSVLIGSSGTVRAIARILRRGGANSVIRRKALSTQIQRMLKMSASQLGQMPGLEARRVDMILAGSILLEECMDVIGADTVRPTDFSLRDGLLEEERELYRQGKQSHLSLHLGALYGQAKILGQNERHLKRLVENAKTVFEDLASIHGLPSEWVTYLISAVILRDTGESISLAGHERHSYYIVKNADLPPMEEWEVDLIAALCLAHEGTLPSKKELAFLRTEGRKREFRRLLGLLRIVDALDLGPGMTLRVVGARVKKSKIRITLQGKSKTGLEGLNLTRISDFLQNQLGARAFILERAARTKTNESRKVR